VGALAHDVSDAAASARATAAASASLLSRSAAKPRASAPRGFCVQALGVCWGAGFCGGGGARASAAHEGCVALAPAAGAGAAPATADAHDAGAAGRRHAPSALRWAGRRRTASGDGAGDGGAAAARPDLASACGGGEAHVVEGRGRRNAAPPRASDAPYLAPSAQSADAPRDRGVGAFPFDDGPAARSGAALAPGEPGGAGAAGAAGRAGAGAGAAPARSASTRRRRAASRFARAASASRCASDGGFFLRRSRAVDSSTACAPRRVRGDEPRSDEKLTAPRARRVRGAEDQALDQLAQGGAVARLRGEGGRVDYYARVPPRRRGALPWTFSFSSFWGHRRWLGTRRRATTSRRRRRRPCRTLCAAEGVRLRRLALGGAALSWDARDSASAQLSVGRHSTNSYRSPRREGRFLPADPVCRASTAATGRRAREVGVAARPARRVHLRSSAAGSGRLRRAARAVSPGVSRARVEASE